MRLFVCGARGSTPAPGPEFVRYGGHTSCVGVAADDDERPRLVLDAGTGLQRLSRLLDGEAFRGTILLGHLHWDHTHGLPFFAAGDRGDSEVTLILPNQGVEAEELLGRAISPPHFPIRPDELEGSWRFESLEAGETRVEGFSVLALDTLLTRPQVTRSTRQPSPSLPNSMRSSSTAAGVDRVRSCTSLTNAHPAVRTIP